jgi:hypothetical protein
VSFLFGFVLVFWWNSTVPDALDLTNPFYFFLVSCLSALLVYAVWHQLGGLLASVAIGVGLFVLLVVGKDKLSSEMGGLSDWELTGIGIVLLVALMFVLWFLGRQKALWVFCSNVFMGMGLALALDVITQENPLQSFSNTNLDLLQFTSDEFLSILVVSILAYNALYYRDKVAPCCFTGSSPPPRPVSPSPLSEPDWTVLYDQHYSRLRPDFS